MLRVADRPRTNNDPGDSSGIPLFPRLIEQVGELFFRELVHDVHRRRRLIRIRIHTHVERPGEPEGKAALRGVQLHARNPEVRQHAVQERHPAPEPPRRPSRNSRAPESPGPRIPSIAGARFPEPARRDPSPPTGRWSTAAQFPARDRPAPPSHPGTSPPGRPAASARPLRPSPACAQRSTKCPARPASSRPRP